MLSRTAEYALRAMVWLAADPETPQTTKQISAPTQVPTGYLSKVMQTLAEAGLVRSQRGLGGGFVLARPPERISVLDVVNAVDPITRIRVCPLNLAAHASQLCPLHKRLDEAMATIESAFGSCSIAALLPRNQAVLPLCIDGRPHAPTRQAPAARTRRGRRPR
jgi:Rrf2 family protein